MAEQTDYAERVWHGYQRLVLLIKKETTTFSDFALKYPLVNPMQCSFMLPIQLQSPVTDTSSSSSSSSSSRRSDSLHSPTESEDNCVGMEAWQSFLEGIRSDVFQLSVFCSPECLPLLEGCKLISCKVESLDSSEPGKLIFTMY
jgi:hypothetical protein